MVCWRTIQYSPIVRRSQNFKIGDTRAVKPLIDNLKDKEPDFRGEIAEALGKIGDKKAILPLNKLLKEDKDGVVRVGAAYGLARLKDSDAFEYLTNALLYDKNQTARVHAISLLGELGSREHGFVAFQ